MNYRKMIETAVKNGGDEKTIQKSVALIDEAMSYIESVSQEKHMCLMRRLNEVLNGKHYTEEFALHDVKNICYLDKDGVEHHGAHWTLDEIEDVTKDKTFPKNTTKWDKYVAYNAMYADLSSKFTDEQVLCAAYLFYFSDKDWHSDGKVWEYIGANKG